MLMTLTPSVTLNMARHENCDTHCRWARTTLFATKCAKTLHTSAY